MTDEPLPFEAFTEKQWSAILAILDDWPHHIDLLQAREDIEGTGRAVWLMRRSRMQFGPPAKVLERAQGVMRQIRKLRGTLKPLPDNLVRWLAPDPALSEFQKRLENLIGIYKKLTGPEFSRRSDYYRDWLYEALLNYWEGRLGGDLSFSRKPNNTPYGPLIDFLTLTVRPILGKAPGPSQMAKVIEQYRKSHDFPL